MKKLGTCYIGIYLCLLGSILRHHTTICHTIWQIKCPLCKCGHAPINSGFFASLVNYSYGCQWFSTIQTEIWFDLFQSNMKINQQGLETYSTWQQIIHHSEHFTSFSFVCFCKTWCLTVAIRNCFRKPNWVFPAKRAKLFNPRNNQIIICQILLMSSLMIALDFMKHIIQICNYLTVTLTKNKNIKVVTCSLWLLISR